MSTIAVDLGGTFIKIGLYNNGTILFQDRFPAQAELGLQPQLDLLNHKIEHLIHRSGHEVSALGVAFPGIVDSINMKILSTNKKYRDALTFEFNHWARDQFDLPVSLESDARSALIGEWLFGAARGMSDVVMITLGTGFGTAALINGKLLHGAHFQAGGMGGHFTVNWKGNLCNCGNIGCVEAEASSWSLSAMVQSIPGFENSLLSRESKLDYQAVFRLAPRDAFSQAVRDQSIEIWASAVVNLVHAYDPELVVMGGGVMQSQSSIIPYVQDAVKTRSWTPWGDVRVVASEHDDRSVLLGIGYLSEVTAVES